MKRIIFVLAVLLSFTSCKKSNPISDSWDIDFLLGSSMTYAWSFEIKDSLDNVTLSGDDTVVVTVAGVNETVGEETGLIRLEAYSISQPQGIAKIWYKVVADTVFELASSSITSVPLVFPKIQASEPFAQEIAAARSFFMPRAIQYALYMKQVDDSVVFREDTRVVYRNPLALGSSWISFEYPFLQTREVVGFEQVSSAGGIFLCAKIQTRLPDLIPDIEFFDYVASEGLIQRTIHIPKILVTSQEDPENTIGWISITEQLSLLSRTQVE